MSQPFAKPALLPASPIWIVRDVSTHPLAAPWAVEVVFVGHANRAELDAAIERLARWPWSAKEDGEVVILADAHADPIGIRITQPSDVGRADRVREILINLFSPELVAHAFDVRDARKL